MCTGLDMVWKTPLQFTRCVGIKKFMFEGTQTIVCGFVYCSYRYQIQLLVTLKKLCSFLIDVCKSFHSLRHLLIINMAVSFGISYNRFYIIMYKTVYRRCYVYIKNQYTDIMVREKKTRSFPLAKQGHIPFSCHLDRTTLSCFLCCQKWSQNHIIKGKVLNFLRI